MRAHVATSATKVNVKVARLTKGTVPANILVVTTKKDELPKWTRALWRALKKKGWTKKKGWRRLIAAKYQVAPSTVTRWLKGERLPNREHRRQMRRELGIKPEVWA